MSMIRKIFIVLLAICMLLTLPACLKKEKAEDIPVYETEMTETEETSQTTVETVGPIGLGRIPADDVVIETETAEVSTEEEVTTEPDTTIPEENPTEEEMQPTTQPSEEANTDNSPNWGGGRA